jgi:TnpA family transposase
LGEKRSVAEYAPERLNQGVYAPRWACEVTDSGQSYPVFGLAGVLGYELMPRIRNVNDCRLFRADAKAKYPHIKALVEKDAIDWQLIKTHFRDILRVAVSIKLGRMTPSTVLRRLGTQSRKNKLYFALCELGRVLRTIFLCKYIGSLSLRQRIHAACNKNEAFHNFAKTFAIGNGGVIADNLRHEQVKVIRYNKLVANLVILHNVELMSRILEGLRKEGRVIEEKHLAGLSPYRFEHLNLLGNYDVDMERPVETFDSARAILREPG